MPYNGETELGTAAVDDLLTAGHINDIRARLGGTIPIPSGRYTTGVRNHEREAPGNEFAPTVNFLCVVPIWLDKPIDVTALCITVVTADAGNLMRLGLYDSDSAGIPDALIEDAGEFSVGSVGRKEESLAASRSLGPGLIWGAVITDSATADLTVSTRDSSLVVGFKTLDAGGTAGYHAVYHGFAAQAYGALPDPCPTMDFLDKAPFPFRILLKEG